jgi:CheY-like chemotaxis protein
MNTEFSFIIIDDSELDCFVTQKFLERTNKNFIIKTFQNAEQALEKIGKNRTKFGKVPVIILLDLQMPFMNGFRFVEAFEKFPPEIQKKYMIIILTVLTPASDPNDTHRILTYKTVNSIIEKPLTKEKLNASLKQAGSNI